MKNCKACERYLAFSNFQTNDYGKPVSQCNECLAVKSLANYYKRKGTTNPNIGLDEYSREPKIKCKDFFFYEHVL